MRAVPAPAALSTIGDRADGAVPAPLHPLLDRRIAAFLSESADRLHALVRRYGSPLNIVWPHAVRDNVERMRGAFAAHGVADEIFYGAKANKSPALVRAAVAAGAGVDVSSLPELEDALRTGLDPARLCATGPAKTTGFHRALVEAGALVAIDSLEELADLTSVARRGVRVRVLLRYRPVSAGRSRFGMGRETIAAALSRLAEPEAPFAFEGFHTHLSGYAADSRAAAVGDIADLVDRAADLGLGTGMIDIGGGLPVRYVEPEAYALALRGQRPERYRLGRVPASFYPYGAKQTAADWIDGLLRAPCRGGTVAGYLRARALRLAIEPGRSLVDQAAISVFRVIRVKPLGDGTGVVFVEGSSFSACETWCASEFLVDPLLVRAAPGEPGAPLRAYVAGHSCLDDDVVTNRFLDFGTAPRPGDLLIYANTAGYQMDLLENEFHRHPMPARLIAGFAPSGELAFVPDK